MHLYWAALVSTQDQAHSFKCSPTVKMLDDEWQTWQHDPCQLFENLWKSLKIFENLSWVLSGFSGTLQVLVTGSVYLGLAAQIVVLLDLYSDKVSTVEAHQVSYLQPDNFVWLLQNTTLASVMQWWGKRVSAASRCITRARPFPLPTMSKRHKVSFQRQVLWVRSCIIKFNNSVYWN